MNRIHLVYALGMLMRVLKAGEQFRWESFPQLQSSTFKVTNAQNCHIIIEPRHEISNNVVCATSKGSDQPAHTRSLIRAIASRLNILWVLSYWLNIIWSFKLKRGLYRLVWVYTCQNTTLSEITCRGSYVTWLEIHVDLRTCTGAIFCTLDVFIWL